MVRKKIALAYRLEIILVLILSACLTSTNTPIPAFGPTKTPLSLPPTWTENPPTDTHEATQKSSQSEDGCTRTFSTELVPFDKLEMVNSLEGWAWGYSPSCNTRIWRTEDGGQTWTDISPDANPQDIVFVLDSLTAWATICQSSDDYCEPDLARTSDGGSSWEILSPAKYYAYWDLNFTSRTYGLRTQYDVGAGSGYWSFYETTDGGITWEMVEIISHHLGGELSFGGAYQTCNLCGDQLHLDQELLMIIDGNLSVQPMESIPVSVSYDRGRNWQTIELDFPNQEYIPGTFHPNRLAVFEDRTMILPVNLASWEEETSDLVFYQSSNGQNWTILSILKDVGYVYGWNDIEYLSGEEIIVTCGKDLCVTKDGAETWERISSNLSFTSDQNSLTIERFNFTDSQNGWAIVEQDYRAYTLWRTKDGGRSWSKLSPKMIPQQADKSITSTATSTPPDTPTSTVTITPTTTTDIPLLEFNSQNSFFSSENFPDITEIHMTSKTSGWAFASLGEEVFVLHTMDGGNSWSDVTPPIDIWSTHIEHSESDFFLQLGEGNFLDKDRAWISTMRIDKWMPQDEYTTRIMLSTTNGGITWRMQQLPPEGFGEGHFPGFIDPNHGWFAVFEPYSYSQPYTGLYRTMDGGDTWETVLSSVGTSAGKLRAFAFGDPTTGVLTISSIGWHSGLYILWTHDGGTNWETQSLPEPEDPSTSDPSILNFECGSTFPHAFSKDKISLLVECRASTKDQHIFSHFLYSTEDGGSSWQSYPAPSGQLHLISPSTGWILGEEIHFTDNGGKSWKKVNEVSWEGQFSFIDANHGWAVARDGDKIALVKTINSGRSWMIIEPKFIP